MNIPPYLERLLLSNEATFKNASLGLNGGNMVFVPPGKSAVLLEISIEPFVNSIDRAFIALLGNGVSGSDQSEVWTSILKRLNYQIQIINDTYSTYINLRESFTFDQAKQSGNNINIGIIANFTGKREELFIYTEKSMYFNFLYPFKSQEIGADTTGIAPNFASAYASFTPDVQVLPKNPTTFYESVTVENTYSVQINSSGTEHYKPVGNQIKPGYSNFPQMEYLRLFPVLKQNSIEEPGSDGSELGFDELLTLPLINVKYALINRRASDYGLKQPGK
jgi:hypothetical protein